jgi:hypothetical protein
MARDHICSAGAWVAARDVDVGVLGKQRSPDGGDTSFEALSRGSRKTIEEFGSAGGDPGERGLGVAEHGAHVDAAWREVHHVERFGEVGVQLEQLCNLVRKVVGDSQLVCGSKQRPQVKTRGFESAAEARW